MNPRPVPRPPAGSLRRAALAGALIAAALATGAPLGGRLVAPSGAAAAAPAVPLPLEGSWHTVANGDRVRKVLRQGDIVWAATEGGGLLRWDLPTGSSRQYLAPQDGLPSNDINAVVAGAEGLLWLATERGLVRFEAATGAVTTYTPSTSPGMTSQVVRAVKVALDGSLWVGFGQGWDALAVDPTSRAPGTFRTGGLARFRPDTGAWDEVHHAEPKSGSILNPDAGETFKTIPSENITDIEIGTDGILWVGTEPYYVFEKFSCPVGDPSCQNGGSWVLAGGGLAARQNTQWANWVPSVAEQSCYPSHVTDLAADEQGRMWVGSEGRGLLMMLDGLRKNGCRGGQPIWQRSSRNRPGPRGNYVFSVDVADDGRVWIGNGDGRDDGLGVGVLEHNGSFDTTLDDTWEFYNLDNGPVETHAIVTALAASGPGPVVLGTIDDFDGDGWGLRSLEARSQTWRAYRTADNGLPSNRITALATDPRSGATWFGTARRGLARFDGSSWRTWQQFGRGQQVAQAIEATAVGFGRVAVDMADQAAFDAAFPVSPRYIRFGDDPTLYRLTRSALVLVGGKRYLDFTPKLVQAVPLGTPIYNVERGPASSDVMTLTVGPDGTLWAGSEKRTWLGSATCPTEWGVNCWLDGGLSQFDGQTWRIYDEHTPDKNGKTIPDQSVQSILVAADGKVWVGTGNIRSSKGVGIGVLDPAAETWTHHPANRSVAMAGMGVSGLAQDPASGNIWASHHAAEDCIPPTGGGSCVWIRYGGGVSRWNGTKWDIWQKPAAPLAAFGAEGELHSILVDPGRGRVWSGGWDGDEQNFHWSMGLNIDATINWCPLDCTNGGWQHHTWPDEGEVVALALDDSANLWAGVHRSGNGIAPPVAGVKVFDGGAWATYNADNSGLPANEVTSLARAGGEMWIGTLSGGASRYAHRVAPTATPSPTASATPTNTADPLTPSATPTYASTEPTPTSNPSVSATTPAGTSPTPGTSTPASATPTERATSPPGRLLHVYLPFAQKPRLCVSCATATPRRR